MMTSALPRRQKQNDYRVWLRLPRGMKLPNIETGYKVTYLTFQKCILHRRTWYWYDDRRSVQKKSKADLWGFFTPPVAGADLRAALVASCFLGALPPVDLRAVCFVRAMVCWSLEAKCGQVAGSYTLVARTRCEERERRFYIRSSHIGLLRMTNMTN